MRSPRTTTVWLAMVASRSIGTTLTSTMARDCALRNPCVVNTSRPVSSTRRRTLILGLRRTSWIPAAAKIHLGSPRARGFRCGWRPTGLLRCGLMKPRLPFLIAFVTLAAVLSLSAQTAPSDPSFGIDLAGMDRSVRPQDDFFRFVNGKWDDATPIPPDMPSYGTFAILRDRAAAAVRGILDEASAGTPATGTVAQKVGGFYRSFMDEPR